MSVHSNANSPLDEIELQEQNTMAACTVNHEPHFQAITAETLIGHIKRQRSFVDKLSTSANEDNLLGAMNKHYEQVFSPSYRFMEYWIFCKSPVVYVGTLTSTDATILLENQAFPQEIRFETVEKHSALTSAFSRFRTLQGHSNALSNDHAFNALFAGATTKQSVFCVGHTIVKERLVWPLLASVLVAGVSVLAAGLATKDVALAVQFGGFVGAILGIVWGFLLWLLR